MVKRFIWDLDGTILDGDFSKEEDLFKENLSEEDFLKFIDKKQELLNMYEKKFPFYDRKMLSEFLSANINGNISEKLIDEWINYAVKINEVINPEAIDVLDYLNKKGIENVVYSNWFTKVQVNRLKKVGLDSYFKEIIGADYYMKPNREGFLYACGEYEPKECVMVGDNYIKDILGALDTGLNAVYYCPNDKVYVPHVKKLTKIKEMY